MDFLLHHMVATSAKRFPEKEALVHGNERLTYAALEAAICNVSATLQGAGCERHNRVGIYLDPSISQVVSIFGISKVGGVCVPINHLLLPEQVSHIVCDCEMSGLIISREKLDLLQGSLSGLPSLRFIIIVGEAQGASPDFPGPCIPFPQSLREIYDHDKTSS